MLDKLFAPKCSCGCKMIKVYTGVDYIDKLDKKGRVVGQQAIKTYDYICPKCG